VVIHEVRTHYCPVCGGPVDAGKGFQCIRCGRIDLGTSCTRKIPEGYVCRTCLKQVLDTPIIARFVGRFAPDGELSENMLSLLDRGIVMDSSNTVGLIIGSVKEAISTSIMGVEEMRITPQTRERLRAKILVRVGDALFNPELVYNSLFVLDIDGPLRIRAPRGISPMVIEDSRGTKITIAPLAAHTLTAPEHRGKPCKYLKDIIVD